LGGIPDERAFLAPLWESVGSGEVQADRLLAAHEGKWGGDIARVYEARRL
jgi:glutamate--cysteine ligase